MNRRRSTTAVKYKLMFLDQAGTFDVHRNRRLGSRRKLTEIVIVAARWP